MQRIDRLDGLRGFLSIMVALYHFPVEYFPNFIAQFFVLRQANNFVDVFFVLSGFVITYTYRSIETKAEFAVFIKKRLLRLYPLLFYSVSVVLIVNLSQYVLHRTTLPKEDDLALGAIVIQYFESILMLNSTPLLGSTLGLNFPSWSISAEMCSYILYGIIVWCTNRRLLIIICIVCFLFFLYSGQYYVSGRYGFIRGILNFVVGGFTWQLVSTKKKPIHGRYQWVVLLAGLAGLFILHSAEYKQKNYLALFLVPFLSSLFIYVLVRSEGFISSLLSSKCFVFLGRISYSIYLNHIFLSGIYLKLNLLFLGPISTNYGKMLNILFFLVLLLLYSFMTREYVEKRGRIVLANSFVKIRQRLAR